MIRRTAPLQLAARDPRRSGLVRAPGGVLLALGEDTGTAAKWAQVAVEGEYRGYVFPDGRRGFTFTRQVFEKAIANFHKHPWFKPGEDGVGTARVVPFDYEHASEQPASTLASTGAPAVGWAWDLQVRDGADGKAQLWALAEWGQQLKGQIERGEYATTSVVLYWNFEDPVTGEDQGPTITSIAVTNNPFIQGMAPLAASMSVYVTKAETPEEALLGLRDVFRLPSEADPEAVQLELMKFMDMLAAGTVPAGVEVEYVLRNIAGMFGLPLLSTRDEILARASEALGSLVTNQPEGGLPAGSEPTTPLEATMDLKQFLVELARVFKLTGQDATEPALALRAVALAAEGGTAATNALEQLQAMFSGADVKSLIKEATRTIEMARQAEPLVQALMAATAGATDTMDQEATEEVAAVAASHFADEAMRARLQPLILRERQECVDVEEVDVRGLNIPDPKNAGKFLTVLTVRKVNPAKLTAFREKWPKAQAAPGAGVVGAVGGAAILTKTFVAGADGQQYEVNVHDLRPARQNPGAPPVTATAGAAAPKPLPATPPAPQHSNPGPVSRVDDATMAEIRLCAGRNEIEQTITFLSQKHAHFGSFPWGDRIQIASSYLKTGQLAFAS